MIEMACFQFNQLKMNEWKEKGKRIYANSIIYKFILHYSCCARNKFKMKNKARKSKWGDERCFSENVGEKYIYCLDYIYNNFGWK